MVFKSDTKHHTGNRVQLEPSTHFNNNLFFFFFFPSSPDKSLHCRLMPCIGRLFICWILLSQQHRPRELCWVYTKATICCRASRNSVISMKHSVSPNNYRIALEAKANDRNLVQKVINIWLLCNNWEHCYRRINISSIHSVYISKSIKYNQQRH